MEAVTGPGGSTTATYGYTAYGQDDTSQFTGADKPGARPAGSPPFNPYRFNAGRADGAGGYNMGFRSYDPGLNQFVSRDMYVGALADQALAADPFTGNRYTFGGGNPLSNIELDGHGWWSALGHAALDAAGMIPVVGAVADVANGAWYAADGDWLDAGLSFAGAIPVIGDAALGARYAVKGAKYAKEGLEAAGDAYHAIEAAKAGAHTVEAVDDAAQTMQAIHAAQRVERLEQQAQAVRAEAKRLQEAAAAAKRARTEAKAQATAEENAPAACGLSFTAATRVVLASGAVESVMTSRKLLICGTQSRKSLCSNNPQERLNKEH